VEILKRNGDYSIRALVVLAGLPAGRILSAERLARAAEVAEPLLRKLLQKLARAGVVESAKGAGGGFRLARAPRQISVLAAVEPVQGKLAVNRCFLGRRHCPLQGNCRVSRRLAGIQDRLVRLFEGISLADLMAGKPVPAARHSG
jgi:Rrf2 family protein